MRHTCTAELPYVQKSWQIGELCFKEVKKNNWVYFRTLMEGDKQGGFSVFWADDGLDTGPILLQKSVDIEPNETVDTLYNRFLYPEGIKGMVCYVIIFIETRVI